MAESHAQASDKCRAKGMSLWVRYHTDCTANLMRVADELTANAND